MRTGNEKSLLFYSMAAIPVLNTYIFISLTGCYIHVLFLLLNGFAAKLLNDNRQRLSYILAMVLQLVITAYFIVHTELMIHQGGGGTGLLHIGSKLFVPTPQTLPLLPYMVIVSHVHG